MDGECFDDLARRFASGLSRRRVLGGLAGAALAALAAPGQALAACLRNGRSCTDHAGCCSGYCQPHRGRKRCAACASGIVCGDVCCPEGALNACNSIPGPNGPVVVCVCPEGVYDRAQNACVCPETCETDDECCSGTCCQGVCCAEGQDICCGGVCATTGLGDCVCPPGTSCAGTATCVSYGHTVTNRGTCCAFPQASFCCADSYPDAGDGVAGCCTRGIDCPEDGRCPAGVPSVQALLVGCCTPDDEDPRCGPDGDCCFHGFTDDGNTSGALECVLAGQPCHEAWPCCSGNCFHGLCA